MQYVNDDMDQQFRKAAEQYPLDTSSMDWNRVAAALQHPEDAPPPDKKRGRFLWLLLLLPFMLICHPYFHGPLSSDNPEKNSASLSPHTTVSPVMAPATGPEAQGTGEPLQAAHKATRSDELAKTPIPATASTSTSESPARPILGKAGLSGNGASGSQAGSLSFTEGRNAARKALAKKAGAVGSIPEQEGSVLATGEKGTTVVVRLRGREFGMVGNRPGIQVVPGLDGSGRFPVMDEEKTKRARSPRDKRFYAGVFAGLDATTIRFQKIEKTGEDKGFVAGYEFGNRWSVEGGLFFSRKYYYTQGRYFNAENMYMPPNSKITDVSGYCRMIELPVSIRYRLASKPVSSWTAGAGISSYFMKREHYDYTYFYANSGYSAVHSYGYDNASKNLFSVLDLSLGYSHRLGRIGDVRVEPYARVPLSALGISKIRFSSLGLHVGLTRPLF